MRNIPGRPGGNQSYEQWRQQMLDETSRFIEWGLAHPEDVGRIPTHPVGKGVFTERVKSLFWQILLRDTVPDR